MTYPVKLSVVLRPIWHAEPPQIWVGIEPDLTKIWLTETTKFDFEFETDQPGCLSVEFLNKTDQDCIPDQNLDKAVVIESVSFFDITDPKFAWAGIYEPVYPEPWATQQRNQSIALKQQLCPHNYLSWNGKWTLTFGVPVFSWIHHVQNLGWIYD